MLDKIPVTATYFYKVENDYVTVSQPGTGSAVLLTGPHRRVWEYLNNHKGETVAMIAAGLGAGEDAVPRPVVEAIVGYMEKLRLVSLEDAGGW